MILPFLTTFFPNVQFIVSTHSPIILQSLGDVVIYDLENKEVITDGDITEIAELEIYLDEIPDYLAWDIATEYKRLKSEFESREDL